MDNESSLSIWSGRSDLLDSLQADHDEITKIKRKVMEVKYQKRKLGKHKKRLSHSMRRNSMEFPPLQAATDAVVDAASGKWFRNFGKRMSTATENGLLLPNGWMRLTWDVFVGIFVTYICVALPISLAFGKELTELEILVDVFFLLDIVVNFQTAYYDRENNLVTDPQKCRRQYLYSRWFLLDLVSSIPWAVILYSSNTAMNGDSIQNLGTLRALKIIRLVRLVRLFRLLSRLSNSALISVFRMFAIFLIGAHWLGCMFHLIAVTENLENNWRTAQGVVEGIENEPWDTQYLLALYWSIVTITTVGYGDISPVTQIEQIFTLGAICVGTLLYMSVFGVIAALASSLIDDNPIYREKMTAVESFSKHNQLSRAVQRRLMDYYEFQWDQRRSFDQRESILDDFPDALRIEVANEINIRMLLKSKLFSIIRSPTVDLRHTDIVDVLAAALSSPKVSESRICLEDEYLFYKDDPIKNVYFILKGTVEMSSKRISSQVVDGGLVGTVGMFDDMYSLEFGGTNRDPSDYPSHKTQAVAIKMTDLYCLHRESFLTALELFNKAREYISWVSQKKTNLFAGLEPFEGADLSDPYEFLTGIPVVDTYERSTGPHKVYSDEHIVEKLAERFVEEFGDIFDTEDGLAIKDNDASTAYGGSFRSKARQRHKTAKKGRPIGNVHEQVPYDEELSIGSADLAVHLTTADQVASPQEEDGGLAGAVARRQAQQRLFRSPHHARSPPISLPRHVPGSPSNSGDPIARLELMFTAISGRLDRIERNQIKLKNEVRSGN